MRNRILIVATAIGSLGAPIAVAQRTILVSRNESATPGDHMSRAPAMSSDGRYVAFQSLAVDLVPNDTNNQQDIFVRDRATGEVRRVSVGTDGVQANRSSWLPSISADGRHIAFYSSAWTIAPNDTNNSADIFVHDVLTGVTTRITDITYSGSDYDLYSATRPAISGDGRFVAFVSDDPHLVAGDLNGDQPDVFVHDRATGVTTLASVNGAGVQGDKASGEPGLSADGGILVFYSLSTNLVDDDTNNRGDVFVRNLLTGEVRRASVGVDGLEADHVSISPAISADGSVVVFTSAATNLIGALDTNGANDVFAHDLLSGVTSRVSVSSTGAQGDDRSELGEISANGRFVALTSWASNLAATDNNGSYGDVYLHDRLNGETTRVSVNSFGVQGDHWSNAPALSEDGAVVAFESSATNLVAGGVAASPHIYLHDRSAPCAGDVDDDGHIGFSDLNLLINAFNTSQGNAGFNPAADFDEDFDVDFTDLNSALTAFHTDC